MLGRDIFRNLLGSWKKAGSSRRWAIASASVFAAVWIAYAIRFARGHQLSTDIGPVWAVADDMYITASFARSLVTGEGLRWFAGAPKVEGFSNPLWLLIMAFLHVLPGFTEERLGRYLFCVDVLLLAGIALLIFVGLSRLEQADGTRPSPLRRVLVLGLALGCMSVCVWVAQGYEIALVGLWATWAFVEALRPAERVRTGFIGLLIGLAFWTRMDAVVSCASAIAAVVLRVRDRRRLGRGAAVLLGMMAALFVLRRLYYGEWLPNTYYLKISGWPLAKRWPHGWFQNSFTITALTWLLSPLIAAAWLLLPKPRRVALLAFLGPAATLAYSTQSGGDFAWLMLGYDRHGSAGTPLLVFGLAAILLGARLRFWQVPIATAWVYAVVIIPTSCAFGLRKDRSIGHYMNWRQVKGFFRWNKPLAQPDAGLANAIYRGKLLEEISEPGARIALCDAGAKVYFSKRGGVDVLGKIEPYVAHLPAREDPPPDRRCWRNFAPSGHNKENVPALFELRKPEFSDIEPPRSAAAEYMHFNYGGREFWARRGSPLVRWGVVSKQVRLDAPH